MVEQKPRPANLKKRHWFTGVICLLNLNNFMKERMIVRFFNEAHAEIGKKLAILGLLDFRASEREARDAFHQLKIILSSGSLQ